MKAAALALCSAVALGAVSSASTAGGRSATSVEKPFKAGGTVRFDLSAGDYEIRGTNADVLAVRWRTGSADDDARVRAMADVRGTRATVRVSGPHRHLRVRIELPRRPDLTLDLTAGDLRVRDIEGNKTLSMWAGDVSIEAGNRDLYRRVDASVRFGDLSAQPFGVQKGGIFRSFRWTGPGKYTLRANLFAGDLTFLR